MDWATSFMETTILLQSGWGASASYPGFVVTFCRMGTAVSNPAKPQRSPASILIGAGFRIALFAITCTGLGMAIGLFTGIVVQVVRSLIHQGAIDMTVAYRFFGIPAAAVCGVAAFIVFSVIETRNARRLLIAR